MYEFGQYRAPEGTFSHVWELKADWRITRNAWSAEEAAAWIAADYPECEHITADDVRRR